MDIVFFLHPHHHHPPPTPTQNYNSYICILNLPCMLPTTDKEWILTGLLIYKNNPWWDRPKVTAALSHTCDFKYYGSTNQSRVEQLYGIKEFGVVVRGVCILLVI